MHKIRSELLAKKYHKREKLTNWNTQLEIYSRRKAEMSDVVINHQYKFRSSGSAMRVDQVTDCLF